VYESDNFQDMYTFLEASLLLKLLFLTFPEGFEKLGVLKVTWYFLKRVADTGYEKVELSL
jgi:hypothetical protein